jgi:hypothetical protein
MFGCETTAVQSTYILLIFMQKNTIFYLAFFAIFAFLENIQDLKSNLFY